MASQNVDLVFVIDASESMQPCFDALRMHLDKVIQPMQGYVSTVRFGMVAQSAGSARGVAVYDHQFLCGSGIDALKKLYQRGPNDPDARNEFFTTDPKKLASSLAALKPLGNEEMLLALDVAADLPFGPLRNTKRVIALFSDEPFEGGISKDALNAKIPALSKKLMDRHIQLFVAIPDSQAAQELAMVDRSEIELIDGGNGLKGVDFKQLLGQMGKSISGSSLQAVGEPEYQRAIFGQDTWTEKQIATKDTRAKMAKAGEIGGLTVTAQCLGVLLDVSGSMSPYLPRLREQIHRHFPDAKYQEVEGCHLSKSSAEAKALRHFVETDGCDALYWFCDLQDGGHQDASDELRELLIQREVTLYIRSLDRTADAYPGLLEAVSMSGGELKRGTLQDLIG